MDDDAMFERAITALALKFYAHYRAEKGEDAPRHKAWAPRWAMDYARIAVDSYGFTDRDVRALESEAVPA